MTLFYLTNEIMVTDNNDHQDKFIAYDDYAEDVSGKRYNRCFGSPGDVASLIGREYLSQEVTRSNSAASQRDKLKPLVLLILLP
jgi:hypothetical protein